MSGDLPVGWSRVQLAEIGRWGSGGTPRRSIKEYYGGAIPWLKIGDLNDGVVTQSEESITEAGLAASAAKLIESGTLLIAMYGSIGKLGIAGVRCATNQAIAHCIPNLEQVRTDFLFELLLSLRPNLLGEGKGGNQPNISQRVLKSFVVTLPPLEIQSALVDLLHRLSGKEAAARKQGARAQATVRSLRQSVLATACAGRLTKAWRSAHPDLTVEETLADLQVTRSRTGRKATDIVIEGRAIISVGDPGTPVPKGWQRIPMTSVATLESGHTPSRKHPEYWNGKIPWIALQDARDDHGERILDTKEHTNGLGLANSAARLLPEGTVCLSRTASVGYVVIMGRPMCTSQDFVNWVCSEALVPEFLAYALLAEGRGIRRFGRGTTHTTIYFPEVKALHIALPPRLEQLEICRRADTYLDWTDRSSDRLHHVMDRIDLITTTGRAKVLRGEVPTRGKVLIPHAC